MSPPPLALTIAARLKKQLPLQKQAAKRLISELDSALHEAKRADAKSCMSFWARLAGLTNDAADLQRPMGSVLDDAELLHKHRQHLPQASELLVQVKQLSELLDTVQQRLAQLEKEARRIGAKGGLVAKLKSEITDKKLEVQFMKTFDAGMSVVGLLVSLIVVYKKLAGKKVSLN